jgi:hypothetical protein
LSDLKGKIETNVKGKATKAAKMTTPFKVIKEMLALKSQLAVNDQIKDKLSEKKVVELTKKYNALKERLDKMSLNDYVASYRRFMELSGSLEPLTKQQEIERKALRKILYTKVA